jgi:hypothetical protein
VNSGLALVDSGLQFNLEIALSGVSAKVQPPRAFQLGRRYVERSDDVIKDFVQNLRHRVKPFSVYDAIGQVTEAEAKELADYAKSLCSALIAWLKEKHPKFANT